MLTVSFSFRASDAGPYACQMGFYQQDGTRSVPFTFVATTDWTRYSFTVPVGLNDQRVFLYWTDSAAPALGTIVGLSAVSITDTDTATFAGQPVLGSDTIAMVTYGGDATLDGKINIDDYGRIDANVASSGSVFGWYNGDFNYDGAINIDDYGIIDGNIANQGTAFPTAGVAGGAEGVSAVPEPASLSVLALGALALVRRRRGN